ncbi:MAG: hypothetical protein JW915_18255 [Chitinispirillaceae bacterium]|nr:hypothetical protein [Chitinispirillaceae bacterium]
MYCFRKWQLAIRAEWFEQILKIWTMAIAGSSPAAGICDYCPATSQHGVARKKK